MQKIAEHINELPFADNHIAVIDVNGKKICVAKYNDRAYAFAYKCPHAGGLLAHGHVDSHGNVVCPLHRYKYSISNGKNVTGEGYYLKHWDIIENDQGVFIDMELPRGIFDWL